MSKPGGRSRNEDACGYWTSDALSCWVIADGAGGHGGGDVASKIVVGAILQEVAKKADVSGPGMVQLLRHANDTVVSRQRADPALRDMRATAAVLLIDQVADKALWGHVGDSRVYCLRRGVVVAQTRDHSLVQSAIDSGVMLQASLRTHRNRNMLFSALGSEDGFEPDVVGHALPLEHDDVFLLCSDGLWEYVEERAMESTLAAAKSSKHWLALMEAELLRKAKAGHDNYTAVAVWIGQLSEQTRTMHR